MTTRRKQINNIRRLIKVAEDFRDSKARLNMNSWVSVDPDNESVPTCSQALEGACGTTCCLAGRAGLEPYFRRQGIKTTFTRGDWDGEVIEDFESPLNMYELFGFDELRESGFGRVFYHNNILTPTGRISKKRTLNAIIANLKEIALENFGVEL